MAQEIQNTDQKSSYRSIFKATSLFGGVEVYKILISIIRSKFIAVLLGPEGMGISGLLQSGIDVVKQVTSLGLSQSAVRDVAEANGTGDQIRICRTVTVLRKLVWGTGLMGMAAVILFSPILSYTSFGNYSYVFPFIILSVIPLLNQLSAGQGVVLQGLRKYAYLAKSSSIGVTIGLITTIPLYYIWGKDGIVPALVINAVISLLLTWNYSRKIKIDKLKLTRKEVFNEGKGMMSLGIVMSLNGLLVIGCGYIIRAFISHTGGVDQVGLYNAGFAIVNTYVGMVFTAMSTDYYPRLAAVNKDDSKCKELINQQIEIAILIISPLLILGIIFAPLVLTLLYSNRFVSVDGLIRVAMIGMVFKAISWSISFVFIAKNDKRTFIVNETIINCVNLLLSIIAYKYWGLTGLGYSFVILYFLYTIIVFFAARKKYRYNFSGSVIRISVFQLFFISVSLISIYLLPGISKYFVSILFFISSLCISLNGLNSRMGLKEVLLAKICKKTK